MIIIIRLQTTPKTCPSQFRSYYPAVNPRVRVILFNDTFNNIAVISWRSVFIGGENLRVPHQLVASHWQIYHISVVSSTSRHERGFEITILVVTGTDCTGSCKSNYHTITTTTAPCKSNNAASVFEVHIYILTIGKNYCLMMIIKMVVINCELIGN